MLILVSWVYTYLKKFEEKKKSRIYVSLKRVLLGKIECQHLRRGSETQDTDSCSVLSTWIDSFTSNKALCHSYTVIRDAINALKVNNMFIVYN